MKPKPNLSVNQKMKKPSAQLMAWTGLALLIIISALSFWSGNEYQRAESWRDHSNEVLDKIGDAQQSLADAESAQRGYVISAEDMFLQQYRTARDEAARSLDSLAQAITDNPQQVAAIAKIRGEVDKKFEFIERIIELVGQRKMPEAHAAVKAGEGRVLMDKINTLFGEFKRDEVQLLKERTEHAAHDFRRAGTVVVGGLLLAFSLLLYTTIRLQREITQRGQILDELVKAEAKSSEASELKSSFLANMSHEIRTPLNGIVGMAKLLENTGLNSEQRDYLDTMKISSNSLLALINQILDFSKIESGKMQLEEAPFELLSLIKSTVSIVDYAANSKNLKIELKIAPEVPEFFLGDGLRLRQVILNLLNNAVKFSDRGTIWINVVQQKVWDSRATLRFEVIDEGPGINAETKAKLFQTFSQGDESTSRKFGGSGLGLAISKQITEMMDGHIGVDSQPGAGSRFYFEVTLKVSKFRSDSRLETTTEMKKRSLGAHILIAEDNKVNQKVVAEMMKMLGCSVKLVADGRAVLVNLQAEKYDLILMDGQMPEMDGYEASRRIRQGDGGEAARKIPIIATTANAIKGDIEKCLEAGMNDYIGKPISYDDLAYKVEKWLARGTQLIDYTAIEKLRTLAQASDDSTLITGLVEIFEQESLQSFGAMTGALQANDFQKVAGIAHSLKSAAANLGAIRLRDMCERIEKSDKDPNAKHIGILIEAAREEYTGALVELRQLSNLPVG